MKFIKEWNGQKRTGVRKQRRREKEGRKRNFQHPYRQLTSATVVVETVMHQSVLSVMYDHVKLKSLSLSLSLSGSMGIWFNSSDGTVVTYYGCAR